LAIHRQTAAKQSGLDDHLLDQRDGWHAGAQEGKHDGAQLR
jgi:hypothetical protein